MKPDDKIFPEYFIVDPEPMTLEELRDMLDNWKFAPTFYWISEPDLQDILSWDFAECKDGKDVEITFFVGADNLPYDDIWD